MGKMRAFCMYECRALGRQKSSSTEEGQEREKREPEEGLAKLLYGKAIWKPIILHLSKILITALR